MNRTCKKIIMASLLMFVCSMGIVITLIDMWRAGALS